MSRAAEQRGGVRVARLGVWNSGEKAGIGLFGHLAFSRLSIHWQATGGGKGGKEEGQVCFLPRRFNTPLKIKPPLKKEASPPGCWLLAAPVFLLCIASHENCDGHNLHLAPCSRTFHVPVAMLHAQGLPTTTDVVGALHMSHAARCGWDREISFCHRYFLCATSRLV